MSGFDFSQRLVLDKLVELLCCLFIFHGRCLEKHMECDCFDVKCLIPLGIFIE